MKPVRKGVIASFDGTFGNYWPSIARLPDGGLAAVWSGGRRNHICPFGKLLISRSYDEGNTWSPQEVLLNSPLDDRDGGITVFKDRVIVTTFNNSREFQRKTLVRWPNGRPEGEVELIKKHLDGVTDEDESKWFGSLCAVGDGKKFGKFFKVPVTAPHGPIALSDKLLYIGRAFMGDEDVKWPECLNEGIYYIESEDGLHWSEPVAAPPAEDDVFLCEPHGFECLDKSVFVAARSHAKDNYADMSIYFNRIENGKFGKWQPSGIHGAPPHFLRLQDGDVLLVYGRREKPYGIRAKLSKDDGVSWGEEIILEDNVSNADIGYPASVQLKNGNILTVWYQYCGDDRLASVIYKEWEI